MKRKLLLVMAILSLCVVLAACKKKGDEISSSSSAAPEVTATPEPSLEPYKANVLTGEPPARAVQGRYPL